MAKNLGLAALAMLLLCSWLCQASTPTCDWTTPRALGLVYPAQSVLKKPVSVRYALEGDILHIHFDVQARRLNVKPNFGPNDYPFQYDVVELFLSVAGGQEHLPYYEFEVTPLNQTFQVQINDTKLPFVDGVDMGIQTRTTRTSTGWSADIQVPLKNLNWTGAVQDIVGNAYAIQGLAPNKSYWSAFLPQQTKPRFHQPRFFQPLFGTSQSAGSTNCL